MSWCAPCQFDSLRKTRNQIEWVFTASDFSVSLRKRADGVDGHGEYSEAGEGEVGPCECNEDSANR
jgi:hypothetical protein